MTVNDALADDLAAATSRPAGRRRPQLPAAAAEPTDRQPDDRIRARRGDPGRGAGRPLHGRVPARPRPGAARGGDAGAAACAVAHLAFLGFGPLREDLVALAAEPRFGGRLHVLDPVAPLDVVPWVASADVDAMPIQAHNRSYELSTPNKLFEALAAGVPVVASDFPGMRAIVAGIATGRSASCAIPTIRRLDRGGDPAAPRSAGRRAAGDRAAGAPGGARALELGDGVGPARRAVPGPRGGRVRARPAAVPPAGDARAAVERRVRLAGLADRERPRRARATTSRCSRGPRPACRTPRTTRPAIG